MTKNSEPSHGNAVEKSRNHVLTVTAHDDETGGAAIARTALRPEVQAADTRQAFLSQGNADFSDHVDALEAQIRSVQAGDMSAPEAMLVAQAAALDAIFHQLAKRAHQSIGAMPGRADLYLKSALRAQSQCAQTIRVLSEVKNPRAVFVKQTNVAHGPQQVNNHNDGIDSRAPARAHAHEAVTPNELLTDSRREQHAATLDARAKGRSGRRNKALEAVGAIDRTTDHSR